MSRADGLHGNPDTGPRPTRSVRARMELARALAAQARLVHFGDAREREVAARRVAEARAIVIGLDLMRMEDGLPADIAMLPLRRTTE